MTVKPTALPLWGAATDITSYGGNVNKRNLEGQGSINPETDISAQDFSSVADHLKSIAATSGFATIVYTADDTDGYAPTINSYRAQHAVGTSFAPTATRTGNGVTRLTWASSYQDSYGQLSAFVLKAVTGNVQSTTAAYITYNIIAANIVDVYVWVAAGTAKSNAVVTAKFEIASST